MKIETLYTCYLESESVTTDTRKISTNCIFFALKGENFNGNTFAKKALELGAKYCVVDEPEYALDERYLVVDDVLTALQDLARHHRQSLGLKIIALTGSNGKTTTKELIHAVLSTSYKTIATIGNLNNHIGVPLTLLRMTSQTEIGIVEMGANHPGEIAMLSNIALPDYGLITNFGKAHLEGFGSLEGVIKAKSELYEYLKADDKTILVNADDPTQKKQAGQYKNQIKFGKNNKPYAFQALQHQPYVSLLFNDQVITSQLTGSYNLNNIAAALTIGHYFNVDTDKIANAISSYVPSNNRSQLIKQGSNTILMDAYNANPTSMMAALENFRSTDKQPKMLFIGDMFELGAESKKEHQAIVDYLETHRLGLTYIIGENFYETAIHQPFIQKYKNFEDLKEALIQAQFKDHYILIKGSRGMALERLLELL